MENLNEFSMRVLILNKIICGNLFKIKNKQNKQNEQNKDYYEFLNNI